MRFLAGWLTSIYKNPYKKPLALLLARGDAGHGYGYPGYALSGMPVTGSGLKSLASLTGLN
jgi:hypothetical protein